MKDAKVTFSSILGEDSIIFRYRCYDKLVLKKSGFFTQGSLQGSFGQGSSGSSGSFEEGSLQGSFEEGKDISSFINFDKKEEEGCFIERGVRCIEFKENSKNRSCFDIVVIGSFASVFACGILLKEDFRLFHYTMVQSGNFIKSDNVIRNRQIVTSWINEKSLTAGRVTYISLLCSFGFTIRSARNRLAIYYGDKFITDILFETGLLPSATHIDEELGFYQVL